MVRCGMARAVLWRLGRGLASGRTVARRFEEAQGIAQGHYIWGPGGPSSTTASVPARMRASPRSSGCALPLARAVVAAQSPTLLLRRVALSESPNRRGRSQRAACATTTSRSPHGIVLAPRRDVLVADDRLDRDSGAPAPAPPTSVSLRGLEGFAFQAFELDAQRVVVAVPRRATPSGPACQARRSQRRTVQFAALRRTTKCADTCSPRIVAK